MKWFQTDLRGDLADVFIFGEVGVGQTAREFVESLGAAEKISLRVDSPGGDSLTAIKINRHLAKRDTVAEIVGECGSASLILTEAARRIKCSASSRLLVHSPKSFAYGTVQDLIGRASQLLEIKTRWEDILVERTKQPRATVQKWLSGDTWFSAAEALAVGLVEEVLPPPDAATQLKIADALGSLPEINETEQAFRQWLKLFPPIETKDRAALLREINYFIMIKIHFANLAGSQDVVLSSRPHVARPAGPAASLVVGCRLLQSEP